MSGAQARSRSVTLASLAASSASVMACRYRRRPFSVNTARHGSPACSGGYTVIPHSASTTTRAESRTDSRGSPLTRACPRPQRAVFPPPGARRAARSRPGCVGFVLILGFAGAGSAMGIPLFLLYVQVRGLLEPHFDSGQGQDRTVDLPLFRGSVVARTT